jgi:hypothetical protein
MESKFNIESDNFHRSTYKTSPEKEKKEMGEETIGPGKLNGVTKNGRFKISVSAGRESMLK